MLLPLQSELVHATETFLKVYKRKEEREFKESIDKKLNHSYGSFTVSLNKSGHGLGLKLSGRGKFGVHITKVFPGGAASKVEVIHKYDRIKAINGANFTVNSTLKEVLGALKNVSGDVVHLRLQRPFLREYPQEIEQSSSKKDTFYS